MILTYTKLPNQEFFPGLSHPPTYRSSTMQKSERLLLILYHYQQLLNTQRGFTHAY